MLKVDTNVTIKIFLKIDERKTIQYHLSSNKGIIVAERNWTRM